MADDVASNIEYEIEQALGIGNATAHIEPCEDKSCPACVMQGTPVQKFLNRSECCPKFPNECVNFSPPA